MAKIEITNCHVHLFTADHVPVDFPHPALRPFRRYPKLIGLLATVMRFIGQERFADNLDRLRRFQEESNVPAQEVILASVARHYPDNTRYVVLPMVLDGLGYGAPTVDLAAQHEELRRLAAEEPGRVIPFATCNPNLPDTVDAARELIASGAFRGLKIYPRLGFAPDHPLLMERLYPLLEKKGLPVMTHCSRGGVQHRYLCDYRADRFTEPKAYNEVLRQFPDLKVCLAHFGGQVDWRAYVDDGGRIGKLDATPGNWQVDIRRMIGGGQYRGLWTDISYTLFLFDDFIPFLRLFLHDESEAGARLRARVLFGSDFYMTRQEELSERAVCFRLRNALGEEVFRQIAETNPKVWLGEAEDRDWPAPTAP